MAGPRSGLSYGDRPNVTIKHPGGDIKGAHAEARCTNGDACAGPGCRLYTGKTRRSRRGRAFEPSPRLAARIKGYEADKGIPKLGSGMHKPGSGKR